MEKSPTPQDRPRVRFSAAERSALAAAMIVGIVLIFFIHAPVGAVLAGCSLALLATFISTRRKHL